MIYSTPSLRHTKCHAMPCKRQAASGKRQAASGKRGAIQPSYLYPSLANSLFHVLLRRLKSLT